MNKTQEDIKFFEDVSKTFSMKENEFSLQEIVKTINHWKRKYKELLERIKKSRGSAKEEDIREIQRYVRIFRVIKKSSFAPFLEKLK